MMGQTQKSLPLATRQGNQIDNILYLGQTIPGDQQQVSDYIALFKTADT